MAIVGQTLADGQLPNTKGTLYTVPVGKVAHITIVSLVNADTASHTVNLYVKRSGGTSRRIIGKAVNLPVGADYQFPDNAKGLKLSAGDLIEGDADAASKVDYLISGGLE